MSAGLRLRCDRAAPFLEDAALDFQLIVSLLFSTPKYLVMVNKILPKDDEILAQ